MGTRDDEYDYLFKGEAVGHREPVWRPRHSRGTRSRPALPWTESAWALPSCRPDGGPAARPGSRAPRWVSSPMAASLTAVQFLPWASRAPPLGCLLLLVSHPPLTCRPLPRLSTHVGTPTVSMGFWFVCFSFFFSFLFCSFPFPSSLSSFPGAFPGLRPDPPVLGPPPPSPQTSRSVPADCPLPSPQTGNSVCLLFT